MSSSHQTLDLFHGDGRLRLELFTPRAAKCLRAALDAARQTHWESIRSPHLFMGLLAEPDPPLCAWAERVRINPRRLAAQFTELFREPTGPAAPPLALHREFFSDNLLTLLRKAFERCRQHDRRQITTLDLLTSVLTAPHSIVAECLKNQGYSARRLADVAAAFEEEPS
jgi:ATP-dependent Clp protease ATP-binding subunit ClpA